MRGTDAKHVNGLQAEMRLTALKTDMNEVHVAFRAILGLIGIVCTTTIRQFYIPVCFLPFFIPTGSSHPSSYAPPE